METKNITKFITCRDMGNYSRLGNQMFQYACMKTLSNKLNIPIHLRILNTNNVFYKTRISECFKINDHKQLDEKWYNDNIDQIYQCDEKTMEYDQELVEKVLKEKDKSININGYFQTFKYFDQSILKEFQFKDDIETKSQQFINSLGKEHILISLHIRRGDISENKAANSPISTKYILDSIKYMDDKISGNKLYLIFSDDHEYCKETLPNILYDPENSSNNTYILVLPRSTNTFDSEYLDLAIMSKCSHHIISASSFSWWGAYLNQSKEKIVITPIPWFNINHPDGKRLCSQEKDIIPNEWIRIEN